MMRTFAAAAFGLALVALPAMAPAAAPPPVSKDPAAASAGAYKLDPRHTSVVARVPHMGGFSYSTFRFGSASGTLNWDPARVENSKVEVTVEAKSIMTPVEGFAAELSGDQYLNAAKYPDVKFVSTGIQRTGPTSGKITGNLTFMGQTKPITMDAQMVGAGKNPRGVDTIGFTGNARFKRSDFGFTTLMGPIGDEIELVIDTEFNKS
jgi:polyisoprenoid-binding protein YceI